MNYVDINNLLNSIKDYPISDILKIIDAHKDDDLFLAMAYTFCTESSVLLSMSDDEIETRVIEYLKEWSKLEIESKNEATPKKIRLSSSFDASEIASAITFTHNIFYAFASGKDDREITFLMYNQSDTLRLKNKVITLARSPVEGDTVLYTNIVTFNENNMDSIVEIGYTNKLQIPYRTRFYQVLSDSEEDVKYIELWKNKTDDIDLLKNEFLFATFNTYINTGKVVNLDAMSHLLEIDKPILESKINNLLALYGNITIEQIPQLIELTKHSLTMRTDKTEHIPELEHVFNPLHM